MRGIDQFIALLQMLLSPEIFNQQADQRAPWVPEDQAWPDLILDRDQVQFLPQLAVVPSLDLLQLGQMGIQLGLGRERGTVDPLEHRIPFIASPISSCTREELQCADPASRWDMRTSAEIHELSLAVERRCLILDVFQYVNFVVLSSFFEESDRVLPRHLHSLERNVGLHDLVSPRFDLLKVLRGKRTIEGKVVVKPLFDGRADGELRGREDCLHGLRHDVGAAMPIHVLPVR